MIKEVYSIYDRATMEYTAPFFALNEEDAYRAIRGAFTPQSQLVLYPSDYTIVYLGDFDSTEGRLIPKRAPVKDIKYLIPVALRKCALDGTFDERGVDDETQENPSA